MTPAAQEPVISARNLDHFYGTRELRKQILYEITTEIFPGEIVILTGPSGSGKTTLLTLAGALRTVEHGSLRVLGEELNGASRATQMAVRRKIGYIFQAHNLLDALNCWQNVQMALGTHDDGSSRRPKERCIAMLEAVGLEDHVNRYPEQLSGGQRQRVAIARALVREPKLVLADEPTAALDRVTGREVVDILHNLAKKQGCTILLVTHDNRILDVADRILSLEDGRLGSFAAGLTANAGRLLNALAKMNRKGDIVQYVDRVSETQFTSLMEMMAGELEQLLKTLSLGSSDAVNTMISHVLEAVTLKIRRLLNADRATLFLVDEPNQRLRSRIAHGEGGGTLEINIPIGAGLAGMVAQNDITLNIPNPYDHPKFDRSVDQRTGYVTRNMLCMPIHDRNKKVFAVAQLLNRLEEGPFTEEDERKFREFADPIGLILESSLRLEALDKAPGGAGKAL